MAETNTQAEPEHDDELARKAWMQLRQSTRIALYYLRGQAKDGYAPARQILAEIERVLADGSTDPVR